MMERVANRRRSRPSFLRRALVISALLLAVLIVFANRLYHTVQRPLWEEMAGAKKTAIEKLNVKDITGVDRFIGDKPYTIVYASNSEGEKVVVWVWDGGIHMMRASDGLTKEEIKQRALAVEPGKQILRITPGKLREEYVWEVFYTKQEDGTKRYYYDYFRFTDGKKLDTYRLAKPY